MNANWRQISREVNVALSTRGLPEHKEYKSEELCKSEDFVSNLSSVYVPDVIVSAPPWSSAVVEPDPESEPVKHKIRWW